MMEPQSILRYTKSCAMISCLGMVARRVTLEPLVQALGRRAGLSTERSRLSFSVLESTRQANTAVREKQNELIRLAYDITKSEHNA